MALTLDQSNQLIFIVAQIEELMAETDEDGAESILDELYMLVTKVLEKFPDLDTDNE